MNRVANLGSAGGLPAARRFAGFLDWHFCPEVFKVSRNEIPVGFSKHYEHFYSSFCFYCHGCTDSRFFPRPIAREFRGTD
jgi:hypothetical protein